MKKGIVYLLFVLALAISLFSAFAIMTGAATTTPELDIAYCNLSFRDSVCIKYAVDSNVSNAKVLIWTAPQTEYTIGSQNEEITEYYTEEISGTSYMIFDYTSLVAKQMTDVIYARAYVEVSGVDYYSEVNKYSILQYAYNKLGKTATESTDENLKVMLADMLEYGASAQKYFTYNIDRLTTDSFYQVKLTDGVLSDGSTHGLYLEGDKVTMMASTTNEEGTAFSHWADSQGSVISTNATYELTVGNTNEIYTPVYGTASEVFTVTFKDYDGTVLKTEPVNSGEAATAPTDPYREGYTFTGWDQSFSNVISDMVVVAQYQKITAPTFEIAKVSAIAGSTGVEVAVTALNNPGVAGMTLSVEYDDDVLTLTKVSNSDVLSGLTFQKPKTYKNGCNLVWYGSEPDEIIDGEAFVMKFDISSTIASGEYPIKLIYSNGTDVNLDPVVFGVVNGSIIIP